jgi:hypothetical protein
MSEQLDNELRKRINEVFENYEDTAPANEGWLLLRQKFPQKKERSLTPLWWSAAATLFILCLFAFWFNNKPVKTAQTTAKHNKPLQLDDTSTIIMEEKGSKEIIPKQDQHYAGTAAQPKGHLQASETSSLMTDAPVSSLTQKPSNENNPNLTVAVNTDVRTSPGNVPITRNADALANVKSFDTDSSSTKGTSIIAVQELKTQQQAKIANGKDSVLTGANSPMNVYLANEQKRERNKTVKQDSKTQTDKKVLYNVYAATYFNYAEGSKTQINTGAGFGTDIKLFSKLKLSTGIAIGKNTLNYNGQPMQAGILNEAVGVSRASANDASSSAPPLTSTLGFVAARVGVTPIVAGYDVSLTGLDVPLNLKYEFNPNKSDSYISAGLSSGTFINETYNYRYDNSLNAFGISPALPDATTRKSFTRFDFARTLNLSLGMGYQITKNNRLVIEPFLKYPLSGLGSQQIRFGAGGVNLRLKFQGNRK